MIKPEDLRIGNWVNHHGEIITVDGIDDIDVFNKKCGEIPLHSILPIPLTEKILLDCGFVKDGLFVGEFVYTKSKYFYSMELKLLFVITGHNGEVLNYEGYEVQTSDNQTIYLHELQNLFYSLTKTELIIKL
mgnify:CR=1 FL=1